MAIRFVCPLGHSIKSADHRAGKKGRCPICHQKVIVPVPNPQPSGIEKRSWDALGTNAIETDDQTPPSNPTPPSAPAVSRGGKRKRRSISRRSVPAGSLSLQPPAAPVAAVVVPRLAIDDPAAMAPSPPPLMPPPVIERIAVPPKPSRARRGLKPEPPPRWLGRMKAGLDPYVYQADARKVEMVYWLAAILSFSVVFSVAPALRHWQLAEAPGWARIMLLVAAAQFAYIAWLLLLPDWSTVWVGMILFTVVGAGYGTAMALFGSMPHGKLTPLGLAGAGSAATGWCGANVVLMGLLSIACGRLATKWRRSEKKRLPNTP
ncbi:MAG TPA: hypothetical protein VMV69_27625 [Pirellulales bacterium]|nr:hypothetical protein [Pirellulales bacterium]